VVERDGLENRFPMEIGTRVRIPLFPPSLAEVLAKANFRFHTVTIFSSRLAMADKVRRLLFKI